MKVKPRELRLRLTSEIGLLMIAVSFAMSRVSKAEEGITVRLKEGAVRLEFCTDKIIRVLFDPKGKFKHVTSLVVRDQWSC